MFDPREPPLGDPVHTVEHARGRAQKQKATRRVACRIYYSDTTVCVNFKEHRL